ncbi:MAG: SAM-dependent methyltransferase, partial [Candidatus Neomarinimicrobiota bacterium]
SKIESIPGASAVLAALISSGLPTDRFIFEGFLPPRKGRKKRLIALEKETATIVFFENPKRIKRTLTDILEYVGNRPAVVCRELTKIYEEIIRGTVDELLAYFSKHEARGECVILIGKDKENVHFE